MSASVRADDAHPRARARSLTGQTALLALGYLIRSIGTFGLVVLLSRTVGPTGFGQVSVFLAVSWGLFYVTSSWVLVAVPALGASRRDEPFYSAVFWTAALLAAVALAGACVVVLGAALVSGAGAEELLDRRAWAAIPVAAFGLLALHCAYALLQGAQEAAWVALLQGADRLLATVFVLGAFLVAADEPVLAMEAMAVASVLVAGGALWLPATRRRLRRPRLDREHLRRTARLSLPLAVTNVCAYVVGWVGVIVLAAFRSDAETGIFGLAFQLYQLPVALAGVWVLAAVPAYAAGHLEDGRASFDGRVDLAARWWSAACAGLGTVAALALVPLFGDAFEDARRLFPLMLIGAATLAGYYAVVPKLVARERTATLMRVSLAGAALNVVLDVLLVFELGVWGVAVGTLAQTLLVTAALVVLDRGVRGLARVAATTWPAVAALTAIVVGSAGGVALALAAALTVVAGALALRETLVVGVRRRGSRPRGSAT